MKKNIPIAVLVVVLIGLSALTYNNTSKLTNSEWVCIAQECVEFVTGDAWIKQNCIHQDNEMMCSFEYEGEAFVVPLSGLNISNMISCGEYKCASNVLVSYNK